MPITPPEASIILAASLMDCVRVSPPHIVQSFARLAPGCPDLDARLLHGLLTGSADTPGLALARQASEIVGAMLTTPKALEMPLESVLNRIALKESPLDDSLAYPQTCWSEIYDIFPKTRGAVTVNSPKLLETFFEQWLAFAKQAATLPALLAGTFSLMDEYLWCIPADAAQPDVPLSEMARLKGAVAACLWQRQQATPPLPDKPFRFVAGDLSGIQAYLFDITEGGASESGTAKRLRARSLFVQLLAEVGMWHALACYALPPCNVMMSSGGKFWALWPNLPDSDATLAALQQQVDAWLLKELHGAIGVAFAAVEVSAQELRQGFGQVIEQSEQALFQQKHRILSTQLRAEQGWNEAAFVIDESFPHEVCPSCGKFPRAGAHTYCLQCVTDKEIGKVMAHHPKWLAFFAAPPQDAANTLPVLGMTVQVIANDDGLRQTPTLLMQLGGKLDVTSAATHAPLIWRQSAPYVNERLSFSPMAQKGAGRDLLGYVKADADHLGMVFQWGFRRDAGTSYDTPARFAALSRQLDRFFSGWLSDFLKRTYRDSYTVFAGGDDLFVIGRWEKMLTCVQEIQSHFRQFAGQHPHFTLSAGMAMAKERYPLAHAAHEAERQVSDAKKRAAIESKTGRDQIALLGDMLSWKQFAVILKERDDLLRDAPRSAFLYHLLQYAEMWRQYVVEKNPGGLRFQPYLAYNLTRNVNPNQSPRLHAWAKRLTMLTLDQNAKNVLNHLGCIATLCIFAQQSGKE